MLAVTPKEVLTFPQTNNSEANIYLCCKSVVPVIYKIQTTSPEKFRVRPRHGLLEPRQAVTINILLRPEHLLGDLTKDKFLIMCMPAPMDRDIICSQNVADIWREKNNTGPMIEQHRLTCLYQTEMEGFRSAENCAGRATNEKTVKVDANTNAPNTNEAYTNTVHQIARRSSDTGHIGRRSSDTGHIPRRLSDGGIMELQNQTHKLEKQLKFTQFMQYFTLFILLLMSVAVVYLLRLEMDFSFLHLNSSKSAPVPASSKQIPLTTRISNSFPKMGRLGRRSK